MSTWNVPPDFQSRFLGACLKAATDDQAFANFRNDPDIGVVVHNTPQWWEDMVPVEFHGETPTETRYRYTAHMIDNLCGIPDWGIVVEIGGGYGGLGNVILSKQVNYITYVIYDLPEVQALQNRYLKDPRAVFPSWIHERQNQLCIAWASWSELHHEAKMEYLHKVMIPAKHLFIGINWDYEENKALLLEHIPDLKEHHDQFLGKILYK